MRSEGELGGKMLEYVKLFFEHPFATFFFLIVIAEIVDSMNPFRGRRK